MAGYRVLAFLLGLIFLALAVGLFFHEDPRLAPARAALLSVDNLRTALPASDATVKKYLQFALSMGAFVALAFSLLFFVSAFAPARMAPFVVVVIVCCIPAMVAAIGKGYAAKISWYSWGGGALFCLLLAILLAAFFPRSPAKEIKPEETVKQ